MAIFGRIALLLFFIAPAQQRVVDQRVLHVDDDAGGSVHARQFLDRQNRFEELGAASAVLLGNLDAHQAELEEIVDEIFVEDALLVHLLDQRTNLLVGKLADVVAEKNFVFGERGQRGGGGGLQSGFGHENTFKREDGKLVILALQKPRVILRMNSQPADEFFWEFKSLICA